MADTPQQPLFHSPAVKLKRARRHLAELEAINDAYVASRPIRHEQIDTGGGIGFRTSFSGPPDEYGAVVGDIMHNLRAALDLMACDLVRANGGNIKNVYFPFCDQASDLKETMKRKNFLRASPEAIELLKSLRPHRGGNDALRAIHDLDIQDKHMELIPIPMQFTGPIIKVDRTGPTPVVSLVPESLEASDFKLQFPPGSALEGKEIVPTLHELVQLTESIVETFKALVDLGPVVAAKSIGEGAAIHPPTTPE